MKSKREEVVEAKTRNQSSDVSIKIIERNVAHTENELLSTNGEMCDLKVEKWTVEYEVQEFVKTGRRTRSPDADGKVGEIACERTAANRKIAR